MAGSVIEEFLVSLGFKIDAVGAKKFTGTLTSLINPTNLLRGALVGLAFTAEKAVGEYASQMEKLYYASKRTGASVENIQALRFGAQQIGVSAEDATAALEGMAKAVRLQPGLMGLLSGFGIKTQGKDTAKVMIELVEKLAKLPHFIGAQFAQMFGIDEQTFLMLKMNLNDLKKKEEERIELNRKSGISAEEAAAASKAYSNTLRELSEMFGVLKDRLMIALLPTFQLIANVLKDVIKLLYDFADFKFGTLEETLDALKQYFIAIKELVLEIGDAITGWGKGALKTIQEIPGKAKGYFDRVVNWFSNDEEDKGTDVSQTYQNSNSKKVKDFVDGLVTKTAPTVQSINKSLPLGLRQNNPGNLRSWGDNLTQNGFATFKNSGEGLSAMAGNLLNYAKRGWNTVDSIISHWAPSNENDTKGYINNVSKRLGVDANQMLNLKDPATLSKVMEAIIKQEQGYNPYGSSELLAAANSRIDKSSATTVNQTNHINVVANTNNPHELGKTIGNEVKRTYGDAVRNNASVVQ